MPNWLEEASWRARLGFEKAAALKAEAHDRLRAWWSDPRTQEKKAELVAAGERAVQRSVAAVSEAAASVAATVRAQVPVTRARAEAWVVGTYRYLKSLPEAPPVQGLAQWWGQHGSKAAGSLASVTLSVTSFGVGTALGQAFPDFDIRLLGIGSHRHWLFHSGLPAAGLGWLGDRMIQHYRHLEARTPGGDRRHHEARARLIMDLERYVGAPFIAGFAVGSGLHLSIDGLIQNGKDVVGFPVGQLLAGGRLVDAVYLFGNGLWAFSVAGKFLAFTATGEADTRRLLDVMRRLPGIQALPLRRVR